MPRNLPNLICFTIYLVIAGLSPVLLSTPGDRASLYVIMALSMVWPCISLRSLRRLVPVLLALFAITLAIVDWREGQIYREKLGVMRAKSGSHP